MIYATIIEFTGLTFRLEENKHSSKVYVGVRQNSSFKVSETGSSIQMTVFRTVLEFNCHASET